MQLILLIGQYFLLQHRNNDFFFSRKTKNLDHANMKYSNHMWCLKCAGNYFDKCAHFIQISQIINRNFFSFSFLLINHSFSFAAERRMK